MMRTTLAAAALVALAGLPVAHAQDKAAAPPKGTAAAPAAAPAASGKELYPKAYFDLLLKERLAQGQPDTPELRNAIRDELNTRELLVREAKKKGVDKTTDVKNQTELAAQTVLVRAYVADWVKANPIPDAALHKEYDTIRGQMGDKEYKVRHILVDKEDDAKEIIASLQKGEKFEKLAERSKDTGSKELLCFGYHVLARKTGPGDGEKAPKPVIVEKDAKPQAAGLPAQSWLSSLNQALRATARRQPPPSQEPERKSA